MNDDVTWYARFPKGDIPGVSYETPPGLDVKGLPGYGSVPEARLSESDSYLLWSDSLLWSDTGGGVSRCSTREARRQHANAGFVAVQADSRDT